MNEKFKEVLNTLLLLAILFFTLKGNPEAADTIKLIIKAQDELNKATTVQVTVNDSVKIDSIKIDTVNSQIDTVK